MFRMHNNLQIDIKRDRYRMNLEIDLNQGHQVTLRVTSKPINVRYQFIGFCVFKR